MTGRDWWWWYSVGHVTATFFQRHSWVDGLADALALATVFGTWWLVAWAARRLPWRVSISRVRP